MGKGDTGQSSQAVVVSTKRGRFPFSTRLNKSPNNSRFLRIFAFLATFLVIVASGWAMMTRISIGNQKISNLRYFQFRLQSKSEKYNKSDFEDQLILSLKKEIAAKQLDISADNKEVSRILAKQGIKKPNSWQSLTASASAIDNQLELYKKGGYKGTIFYFPFSRNFYAVSFPQSAPFGDSNTIKSDKQYSEDKAKSYLKDLQSGTKSVDQVLKEIQADDKLILGPTSNLSKNFSVDESGYQARNGDQVKDAYMVKHLEDLKSLKAGQFSPIKIQKTLIPYDTKGQPNKANQLQDVQYYFIKLDAKPAKKENIVRDFNKIVGDLRVKK